jgi:hypothetical protein
MFVEGFRRLACRFAEIEPTDDPAADLLTLGRAFRANALANPHLYDLMFGTPFPGFCLGDEEAAEAFATFEALVVAVRRCMAAGVIAPADPNDVALLLFGQVEGLAGLELRGWLGTDEAAGRRWDLALQTALRGLSTEPAGQP